MPVQNPPSLTLPWDETLIMPIGDVQFGSAACDFDKFRRHMDWGMKHGAYFIGMGDYVDFGSPSNRGALKALEDASRNRVTSERAIADLDALADLRALERSLAETRAASLADLKGKPPGA